MAHAVHGRQLAEAPAGVRAAVRRRGRRAAARACVCSSEQSKGEKNGKETPEAHVFTTDVPGLTKVEVEDGNVLQIRGEAKLLGCCCVCGWRWWYCPV